MAKGTNGLTLVSKSRLELFKALYDLQVSTNYLGIHATADAATVLATARTIDGVSFDGSANITLPNKFVKLWYTDNEGTKTWYSTSAKAAGDVVSTFTDEYLYVNMVDKTLMYYDGTKLENVVATDSTPRIASSEKGVANGVATLDANGLVPSTQLPSYVDDVVEITVETTGEPAVTKYYLRDETKTGNKGAEITSSNGERDKIYFDPDATIDGCYRWSGSALVPIGTKVSTADRAINDADGNPINTTYVKVQANKDLMTSTQAQQLQDLVDHDYDEISESEVKAMFDSAIVTAYETAASSGD